MDALLDASLAVLPPERLWVNPDCGLKTRGWPEVEASLAELVAGAARARARLVAQAQPPSRAHQSRS